MDSWTLKGDSYSFLRSAPRTISLRNREGTPNHVEIFDITNIPSPRSAISETTCLCDIFGDDPDSPSLPGTPASGAFVPPPREVDRGAAASPLVDDSSGSYHTANGSSEGEEGFEDPKERLRSPLLPTGNSEGQDSEGHNQTSERSGLTEEIPKLESAASPSLPPLSTEDASLEVLNGVSTSRTPSPRHNSSETLKSAEDRGITSSPPSSLSSHRTSSPSRSPQPSNLRASSSSISSIESQLTPSLLESRRSPKGSSSSSGSRKSSPSSEQQPQSSDHLRGLTPSTFEARVVFSSNSTSRSSVDIHRQSGERSTTPEFRDYSDSPDTQDCSPFSELRGRVSVHDLFRRGSTPDIDDSPCTPELISCTLSAGGNTPESRGSKLSAEAKSAASTPLPTYTPPTPVSSIPRTPEYRGHSVSPAVRFTPSPALSLGVPHTAPTPDCLSQAHSPVPYSLPSRTGSSDCCPKESDYTSSSPEITVTASSPEVRRREKSLEEDLALNPGDPSQCSRATTCSPHITGPCYSVVQPKDGDTATYTEIAHLSTSEPIYRNPQSPEPQCKSPVRQIDPRTAQEESTVTIVTPDQYYKYSDPEPDNTELPQPRDRSLSPEPRSYTPSPELRNQGPSPETRPYSPLPEQRNLFPVPEKREDTPSPEQRFLAPSPGKIHYTRSPEPIHFETQPSPSPEPRSQKVEQYNYSPEPSDILSSTERIQLTPSPELRNLPPSPGKIQIPPSPQQRDLTPSPEKRQLTPSPQSRDPTQSPEKSLFNSSPQPMYNTLAPEKSQLTPSPEPRYPTPSPVNIHYTPSPEQIHFAPSPLDRQYSPMCEPKHTVFSPEEKGQTQSPGLIHNPSSPVSSLLVPSPEPTFRNLSPERRYQSISPASRHHVTSLDPPLPTVSSESRMNQSLPDISYRNLSPDTRYHTPSPRDLVSSHKPSLTSPVPVAEEPTRSPQPRHISHPPSSRHQSPQIIQSPEYRIGQPSPTGSPLHNVDPFSTRELSLFPQDTPGMGESSLSDTSNYSQTAVDRKSAPLETNSVVKPPGERKSRRTPEQHCEPSEITPTKIYPQSVQSNYINQKEDHHWNPPIEIHSPFHGLPVSTVDGQPDILLARQTAGISPVRQGKHPKPKFPINSRRSDKNIENKNSETPRKLDYPRKQPTTKVVILSREEPTEDTARHGSKRRTPSPPITRFTPVHIIAPEKPYRVWQNRCRSPPQAAASTLTDNFKNQMAKWESPGVTRRNSNNQDDWLGQNRQMGMAGEIPLEQHKCTRKGMESERKREERLQEKKEGTKPHASYRGQQVELSFNARNRKGPESHSASSTGKQTSKGMLTAHSYSERLPATRQPQQQQRRGGPARRLQPSVPQNMNVATGRVFKNRPRQSSSSSMGSEQDEADSEVKWFTDGAFHSLSSPEIDYLDMYNSSHRSSTNISQPSTQESPAGASVSLLAYADFRGSGQRLDNEDFPFQPTTYYSDGLDSAKRYEMGSFECVDVAVEREEPRKARRGVPKRQIQLKRKNTLESRQDESSENGSPVVPGMADSPSFQGSLKETLLRQHSTPVTMHEPYPCKPSTDIPEHNNKTLKLKKSTSLDETHPKTKMATCLIKSVLSKKMQGVDSSHEEKPSSSVQAEDTLEKSTENDTLNQSQFSLLSADPAVGTESNTMASDQHFAGKRSSSTERTGMRSELMVPFRRQADGCEREEERAASKSASTTLGNKGVHFATGSNSHMEVRQEQEYRIPSTEIKDGLVNDKKKSSLNVSLTPELDIKPDLHCEVPSPKSSPKSSFKENEDKGESPIDVKTEEGDVNGNNKVKVPMHKVRDVRRLVKNTYNLSFKASNATTPSPKMEENLENEEIHQDRREEITEERKVSKNCILETGREDRRKEEVMTGKERGEMREDRVEEPKVEGRDAEHPTSTATPPEQKGRSRYHSQPMQIECKAVCLKEDKEKKTPRMEEGILGKQRQAPAQLSVAEASKPDGYLYGGPESHVTHRTTTSKPCESDANKEPKEDSLEARNNTPVEAKPETARRYKKPPSLGSLPKLPSKEREVSTAVVVIRDGFSKHKDERPMPAKASNSESSGHAVSMLLKEKGYQAEIGAVLNEGEPNTVGGKGMPHKHVNRLEIPLQICSTSEGGVSESRRERTFSTSSAKSTPTTETPPIMGEEEIVRDSAQQNIEAVTPPIKDFDALKRQDPTFPPRSPALRNKPQQIEVKSLSKELNTSTNLMQNKKSQSIEVKSISNNQTKPAVPPKPNYKFKPPDLGPLPNESQTPAERSQTIVVSSPTIYRKLTSDSTSASNYTRKLAVSAVSSCRPPQNKTTTTVSSRSDSSALSDKDQPNNRARHPQASAQSSSDSQRSAALAPVTNPATTSDPGLIHGPNISQISGSSSTVASGSGQSAVVDLNSQPQYSRSTLAHDQARTVTSNYEKQPTVVSTTRVPQYAHEQRPFHRSLSSERSQRADDLRFYCSDDPPSYDERESFSPLMLQGLTPKKLNRYFSAPRPPPCSCTSGCPSHTGLTPPHRHHSPHNHTPPASAHSPGHPHPYPIAPPPLRPHQCRAEPPPLCYQPGSPKSSPLGPGPPPTMYHPLNQPPSYPPHPSLMQPCAPERPLQPHQHMEPRRPSLQRSSQQQSGMSVAPYGDHGPGHSPGLAHLDSQYMCGPQGMGPSYGSEYEGDGSSMYSEGSFGQTPRRMLMDPETGKYFYIEVPVQPLRKMLFDPETGQYVEVLIPQQSMSHSGMYPPTAAPYPSMHNPNMYAPAPQYMQPYAAPPPPHPQTQPPPPPRHPDSSSATALHQNGAGVVYGGPPSQGSKMDPQTHQPLDQGYLEGMYYVPTGMNASPNPPPPDFYHKHSPGPHSGAGGKRS